MAKEIKCIDVENDEEEDYIKVFQKFGWELKSSQRIFNQDSRPVGAISYEGLTYVHSETDTVNFTKLVFERDTKIPNYYKLKKLEEEFWELSEDVSYEKPYMPPHVKTMEDWAKHFEPDLRIKKEKVRLHVFFSIIMAVLVYGMIAIGEIFEDFGTLAAWGAVIGGILLGVVWYRSNKRAQKRALRIALKPKQSNYRSALERLYNNVINQINTYDDAVERIREIVILAENLLNI